MGLTTSTTTKLRFSGKDYKVQLLFQCGIDNDDDDENCPFKCFLFCQKKEKIFVKLPIKYNFVVNIFFLLMIMMTTLHYNSIQFNIFYLVFCLFV